MKKNAVFDTFLAGRGADNFTHTTRNVPRATFVEPGQEVKQAPEALPVTAEWKAPTVDQLSRYNNLYGNDKTREIAQRYLPHLDQKGVVDRNLLQHMHDEHLKSYDNLAEQYAHVHGIDAQPKFEQFSEGLQPEQLDIAKQHLGGNPKGQQRITEQQMQELAGKLGRGGIAAQKLHSSLPVHNVDTLSGAGGATKQLGTAPSVNMPHVETSARPSMTQMLKMLKHSSADHPMVSAFVERCVQHSMSPEQIVKAASLASQCYPDLAHEFEKAGILDGAVNALHSFTSHPAVQMGSTAAMFGGPIAAPIGMAIQGVGAAAGAAKALNAGKPAQALGEGVGAVAGLGGMKGLGAAGQQMAMMAAPMAGNMAQEHLDKMHAPQAAPQGAPQGAPPAAPEGAPKEAHTKRALHPLLQAALGTGAMTAGGAGLGALGGSVLGDASRGALVGATTGLGAGLGAYGGLHTGNAVGKGVERGLETELAGLGGNVGGAIGSGAGGMLGGATGLGAGALGSEAVLGPRHPHPYKHHAHHGQQHKQGSAKDELWKRLLAAAPPQEHGLIGDVIGPALGFGGLGALAMGGAGAAHDAATGENEGSTGRGASIGLGAGGGAYLGHLLSHMATKGNYGAGMVGTLGGALAGGTLGSIMSAPAAEKTAVLGLGTIGTLAAGTAGLGTVGAVGAGQAANFIQEKEKEKLQTGLGYRGALENEDFLQKQHGIELRRQEAELQKLRFPHAGQQMYS